jgi:hypothetical protein
LVGIVGNLLMLGEEMIVMWANNNLRFPQFSCLAWVPEERRDRNKPIQYVVTASPELERNLTSRRTARRASPREDKGSCRRELRPRGSNHLCVHVITRSFVATITHGSVVQFPPVSSSVLNK